MEQNNIIEKIIIYKILQFYKKRKKAKSKFEIGQGGNEDTS